MSFTTSVRLPFSGWAAAAHVRVQPFALVCGVMLGGAAHAQPVPPAAAPASAPTAMPAAAPSAERVLAPVTVTATLAEHAARTAPASVTVIGREELAARQAVDLLDAVRGAPGLTLSPRQVGGRKTLALRGLEGKHTLTLIDGRRISASDDVVGHSDYQYGWLPMSAIERIEIIRGPMSALYGSEALGGVVNLITRRPKDRWIGSAGLSGSLPLDNDEGEPTGAASVFATGPLGDRFTLRVNGEVAHSRPVTDPRDARYSVIEGRHSESGGLSATAELDARQTVEAGWNGTREERTYDTVSSSRGVYRSQYDIERAHAHIGWEGRFDAWRARLRAYRSEIDIENSASNGVSPTRPQNLVDDVIDGHASFALGGHQITFGGEWRDETLVNAGLVGGSDSAAHKALFVQDEYSLTPTLMLTAGLRADHHELFGKEVSPRAYLVWDASPELVVKGGFGHAFKAPTLKQISPNYVGAEGPHTFAGNADIQPESSNSFEIGADWQLNTAWNLRATAFNTEVKDLITYRLLRTEGVRRFYQYDNVDAARIRGLETGVTWEIDPRWTWSSDITFLKTRDKATGARLADRPSRSATTRLEWKAAGYSARVGGEFVGRQQATTGATLPSYALWNASLGREVPMEGQRKLVLRAGLENIGNLDLAGKSEDFGYAERARRLTLSARMDF